MERTVAPHGAWESTVTADLIASASVRLGAAVFDAELPVWLEARPTEGGRSVLTRRAASGTIEDVTPPDMNVRTLVHEYGGGAFLVAGGTVFSVDFDDQRLYRQDRGDDPVAISPEPDAPRAIRFADMRLTPDGQTLVAVRERHLPGGEVVNELVTLPATGGEPRVIATGRDFYAAPAISPDGRRVAWLEWDHPNMPWDGTELLVADLAADGGASDARRVMGGPHESLFQPEWSPEGVLHVVSDRSGWWNLYRLDDDGAGSALAPMEAEQGQPMWTLDAATWAFLSAGRIAMIVSDRGIERVDLVTPGGGAHTLDLPFTSIDTLASDGADRLLLIAAHATLAPAIVMVDTRDGSWEIVRQSSGLEVEPDEISVARPIEFPTTGGLSAHALFYAPTNPRFAPPDGELPPLLVFTHGGPTGQVTGELNLAIQYWTSRGFAVVDVNYGGSTGYGRAYRERLKRGWGVVDVDDCVNAARWLAAQGLVDERRMAIRGGSVGGYTTLTALALRDVFAAGASYFGIGDLATMARDTHKFESRYLDGLVGPWPEAEAIYRARSAVYHTDTLSAPMILFQGLEDAVVPPNQAEDMVAALAAKGVPHAYIAFPGEQHGFRQAANIRRSMEAELFFYGYVFGFTPADEIEPVEIVGA